MQNTKFTKCALALLLAVFLMMTLAFSVFAEETTAAEVTTSEVTTSEVTTSEETTAATTDAETTEVAGDAKKGLGLSDYISLGVLAVVILAVVIYCLTHKEKVAKFWNSMKSEFKKIVWLPWNQVRKNTLVVLVVTIVIALLIALADFIFTKGIYALGLLF